MKIQPDLSEVWGDESANSLKKPLASNQYEDLIFDLVEAISKMDVSEKFGSTTYYFSGNDLDSWEKQKIAETTVMYLAKNGRLRGG